MNKSLSASASLLLGSNLIALVSAILLHWNVFEVVLLYWIQSLFIGVFQHRKIKDMLAYARRKSGKELVLVDGARVMPRDGDGGFAIIYGLFWAVLGSVLLAYYVRTENLTISPTTVLLQSGLFFIAHWWSYRSNKSADERRAIDVMNSLGLPLLRMVLPLHVICLVIDLGSSYSAAVIITWMLLKSVVDVGTHLLEHSGKYWYLKA